MGLLDNYTGIGMSPRPKWMHQRIISRALVLMYDELEQQGLVCLPEATVTDNWDDLAPDLVIFDSGCNPVSIIEISTHREYRKIIQKCYDLIVRFPKAEYFVYDYEGQVLYKLDFDTNTWIPSTDELLYSDFLSNPVINYLL